MREEAIQLPKLATNRFGRGDVMKKKQKWALPRFHFGKGFLEADYRHAVVSMDDSHDIRKIARLVDEKVNFAALRSLEEKRA